MNIKIFFAYLKNVHSFFGSVSLPGQYSNMNQNLRAGTTKLFYSQGSKHWFIKKPLFSLESTARGNAPTKFLFPDSRQENELKRLL